MTPPFSTSASPAPGMGDPVVVQPEQLFRAIFEQAAVGVALIETATGRFIRVNRKYCEIVGLSHDNMMATTFMAITHPDDLQADLEKMEALKAGRIREFCMEKRYFRSDSSLVWVNLTVSPLWEVGAAPSFHIAVVQDITGRKQVEQNLSTLNRTLEQQITTRTGELEESRHRLNAIVEGTSDAVFLKDAEGRYTLMNEAASRFVGRDVDEVLGKDDHFLFSPAEAKAVMAGDREVLARGQTMTYEDVATTADGVQRTFLSTKGPLFDEAGHVVGLFGISRDITDRKHAEAQLRESEERFNQAIQLAKLGIFDHDHRTETLYWSPTLREICGLSTDEPASLDGYIQLIHPDDRDAIVAAVRRAHDPAGDGLYRVEHRLLRRNGTVRWVSLQSRTYFEGEGPARTPVRTVGAMVDMTERKQAEEVLSRLNETLEERIADRTQALQVSERFRKEILDSLSSYVAVLDPHGVIIDVNRVWEQAEAKLDPDGRYRLGVGTNYLQVCRRAMDKSREAKQVLDGISDVLSKRRTFFETQYFCVAPGVSRWFAMRVTPLSGLDGGAVVVHEDITQRKQTEEEVRASYRRLQVLSREVQMATERERSRLSRELHDEFGQLLSALKFDLGRLPGDLRKRSASSRSALQTKLVRASLVVDRLFSSLRELLRGLRPAVLEELGLVPALETLVSDFEERWGLCCELVVDDQDVGLTLTPEAEGALYRIAQELLTNVWRHAAAKHVTVRLHDEDGGICLTVKDDGRGMSKSQRMGKNQYGLRGVRERVELLGGYVQIRSGPSRGSTVSITVPRESLNLSRKASRSSHSRVLAKLRRLRHEQEI